MVLLKNIKMKKNLCVIVEYEYVVKYQERGKVISCELMDCHIKNFVSLSYHSLFQKERLAVAFM